MGKREKNRNIKIRIIVFTILTVALVLGAVFSSKLCPYDPYQQDLAVSYNAPSMSHLMGTDAYGRDMFSRVIIGSQTSILSTLALVAIIAMFGTLIGTICGYFGGPVDSLVMRVSDLCLAFPGLVFALAVAAILGGGIINAVLALALISWPKYSRVARSSTLSIKTSDFVQAAKVAGGRPGYIIFKHIIPNIAGPILVTAMLDIGTMLMELAGLSFLGLGAQPPVAEWGSMMSNGRSMLQTYPWVVLSPGIAIFISVVIFNLLGDTIRDFIDPKNSRFS